jgi:hypothetical protein
VIDAGLLQVADEQAACRVAEEVRRRTEVQVELEAGRAVPDDELQVRVLADGFAPRP